MMETVPGISPDALAVLALTSRFGAGTSAIERPLAPRDWGRVARALQTLGLRPADLLGRSEGELGDLLGAPGAGATIARLLVRASTVGVALEQLTSRGVWVVSAVDDAYPQRLRDRLGETAPPVLFGVGPQGPLGLGGVAIVGSRDASADDLEFAAAAAAAVAASGRPVISGGARGVDSAAMMGAVEAGGTAIGALADSLERQVRSSLLRTLVADGRLTLISPYGPNVPFSVGNAMSRNRLIYCLADAAVVVRTAAEEGGTWAGAVEALKAAWVPIYVRADGEPTPGNAALIALGARPVGGGPGSAAGLPQNAAAFPASGAPAGSVAEQETLFGEPVTVKARKKARSKARASQAT